MKITKYSVVLEGIKPIMFNSYVSKDIENIPPEKKMKYDGNKIVIESDRIMSFLIDNNPKLPSGCIKLFTNMKKYKTLLPKAKAYIGIHPRNIPLTRDGKELTVKDAVMREDKVGGGGVPNLVKRPMIEIPWELKFQIDLVENPEIPVDLLKDWFDRGGIEVALGAWRPIYGQFIVKEFKEIEVK